MGSISKHGCSLATAVLTSLLLGCAGTGGMTVADEQQAGERAARRVEEQVGIYPGEFVSNYVDTIGRRLVARLGDTPYYFKFKVIDQAEPNAFATPGGYVFMSRGLLALINSEDELAGILAHEISHVTQRHHARRSRRAVVPSALTIPGRAVGSIIGEDVGNIINAPIALAGEAYLSSYGRAQEIEADSIGMRLAARAGYDPTGLARVLANLERTADLLTGRTRRFSFFDGHPTTPMRIADIEQEAAQLPRQPPSPVAGDLDTLYNKLDGLTWGSNNPMQGVFRGQQFMQADMNLSVSFPDAWRTINTPRYVGAFAPDNEAIVLFGSPDRPGDARTLATEFSTAITDALEIEPRSPVNTRIGDWPAWVVKLDDTSGTEPVSLYYVWVDAGGAIFRFIAVGPNRYSQVMRKTAESLRRLRDEERRSIVAQRIRIASALAGENIAELSARSGNRISPELTAAINALPAGRNLVAGQPVKIVRDESYLGP